MTFYEYKCSSCGNHFDKEFKMGEARQFVKCVCGSKSFRVFVAPSIRIANPVSDARFGRGKG